jgi:hypothetical protein
MRRYIKFPIIIRNKVEFVKGKPSEEEYLALTSIKEYTVLLLVSLARLRFSAIISIEKEDNL